MTKYLRFLLVVLLSFTTSESLYEEEFSDEYLIEIENEIKDVDDDNEIKKKDLGSKCLNQDVTGNKWASKSEKLYSKKLFSFLEQDKLIINFTPFPPLFCSLCRFKSDLG